MQGHATHADMLTLIPQFAETIASGMFYDCLR